MTIEQSKYIVDISLVGPNQGMLADFTTPDYVVESDFSIEDVVLPEGVSISDRRVVFNGSTPSGRKQWGIAVYYVPSDTEGTVTYVLRIKNEKYSVTSIYRLE